jgi:hypothetical protein
MQGNLPAGAIFVAASGNIPRVDSNSDGNNDVVPFYPSQYTKTIPGVISVGGCNTDGSIGGYSSWGR